MLLINVWRKIKQAGLEGRDTPLGRDVRNLAMVTKAQQEKFRYDKGALGDHCQQGRPALCRGYRRSEKGQAWALGGSGRVRSEQIRRRGQLGPLAGSSANDVHPPAKPRRQAPFSPHNDILGGRGNGSKMVEKGPPWLWVVQRQRVHCVSSPPKHTPLFFSKCS